MQIVKKDHPRQGPKHANYPCGVHFACGANVDEIASVLVKELVVGDDLAPEDGAFAVLLC